MVTLAVLDARLTAQLDANREDSAGMAIVCRAISARSLLDCGRTTRPAVLVVNLDSLGAQPKATLDELVREIEPRLTLTIYYFEKREVIRALVGPNQRVLRGPITVAALRAQLTSLLVDDAFATHQGTS